MTCQNNIKLNSDLQLALSSQRNVVSVEGHSHSRDHSIGHNSGHLHLVILQMLLSKATYNWGIHKAINLEEANRQRKCS